VKIGSAPWNKNISATEDTRLKMSISAKARSNTEEGIAHLKNARKLRKTNKLSEETKLKISLSHRLKYSKSNNHPNYNRSACQLFEDINRKMGWNGQHAENGGEFFIKELGYWVDYYEPNFNIVIEFDEPNHKYRKEKDEIRQREITEYLKCKFIRINSTQNLNEIIDTLRS
jgi:hypothetical protein